MEQQAVIIVDDDAAVRESLGELLDSLDIPSKSFDSGEGFLGMKAPPKRACVLLDINLPGLSGFEVLACLKRAKRNYNVILITGRASGAMKSKAISAGALTLLEKPLNISLLMHSMGRALQS